MAWPEITMTEAAWKKKNFQIHENDQKQLLRSTKPGARKQAIYTLRKIIETALGGWNDFF